MGSLKTKSVADLLSLHAAILDELRERSVIRTANNPTGDLAEFLFCKALNWEQAANSEKAFDAVDSSGRRYQIKARRLHGQNRSRQLSAIRNPDGFDHLAAVLFGHDFEVVRAALIPASVVKEASTYNKYTNSQRFMLQDRIWTLTGVVDVTEKLKSFAG